MSATTLHAEVVAEIAREARVHGDDLAARAVERVTGELSLDFATRRNLEIGTRTAVERFVGVLEDRGATQDTALYEAHGRAQCAAGRSLRELLAIYRSTGLLLWEAVAAMPSTDRLTGMQAMELGGRWLALMDGLSLAAVDGYLAEGAQQRRRDRARRDRLHALLLSEGRDTDPAALQAAAARAGWDVPERVRVAVGAVSAESDAGDAERSPVKVLAGSIGHGRLALIVADGDDAESLLRRAADAHDMGGPVAIGPATPPARSVSSLERAGALLDGLEAGAIDGGGARVVRCDDHELPLLLGAAPDLVAGLVERRLEPLLRLPERRRAQVAETLGAWLAEPHRPQAIADRLGVHVGTIRYRLARLREMFGDALDDPNARLELGLALRAYAAGLGDASSSPAAAERGEPS